MTSVAERLWKYLFERSPASTSEPDIQAQAHDPLATGQLIERDMEMESAVGLSVRIGKIQSLLRGDQAELVRTHEQKSCLLGCNHVIKQLQPAERDGCHTRGLGGLCVFCLREYAKRLQKGQISPFDAERLSLVCSDCARITSSGVLCCPKHYTVITAPDGSEQYIDQDGAAQLKRQQTLTKALGFMISLFGEEETKQPSSPEKESSQ